MFDALSGVVDIITTILDFFQSLIDIAVGFVQDVQAWWATVLTILGMMPPAILVIVGAGFALLLAFVIIELLRDFL